MTETARFFDEMAPRYDADLEVLGWDPVGLVRDWPFHVAPGATVLDAGCGTGAVLEHFSGAGRKLVGFDVSPGMIRAARRRRSIRVADLHVHAAEDEWPMPDASVDAVVALAMLEFVETLDRAFDEIQRCLTPFGRAIVSIEDVVDADGVARPSHEVRYGRFPLWRRSWDDVDLCIPPGLRVVRREKRDAYRVLELGFTCTYHVVELERVPDV